MGCRHEEQARKCLRRYARIIQQAGFPCRFHGFHITNVAATANAGFEIHLASSLTCEKVRHLICWHLV
jgi:TATA-box binding protein (TBP) (component of TFIID and TFIIIB)